MAYVETDGSAMYILHNGTMYRLDGPDYSKMSDLEINVYVNNIRRGLQ
jgi:hypothetical protein